MSDDNASKLDLSGMEKLLTGIVGDLQKALSGIDSPRDLKRADWPRLRREDVDGAGRQVMDEIAGVEEAHRLLVDKRRRELAGALDARKERLESAARPIAPEIRPKRDVFVVSGRVFDEEAGVGLPNVVVKAFDLDRKYDDLLGETLTDENGYYAIEYSAKDFKDVFDAKPETYIEVLDDGGNQLFTSTRSFVHKAGTNETIDAKVDGSRVEGSLVLARDRQRSAELVLKETKVRKAEVLVRDVRLPTR